MDGSNFKRAYLIFSAAIPLLLTLALIAIITQFNVANFIFWKDAFKHGQQDSICEIAVTDLPSSRPFEEAMGAPVKEIRKLRLPLRLNPPGDYLRFPKEILLKARCEFDTNGLDQSQTLWLSLGSVLSRIGVWIDGEKIYASNEVYYFPAIPLPKVGPSGKYQVVFIGATTKAGYFSLGSMIPIVIHDNYKNFQSILKVTSHTINEYPIFSISLSLGLITLFVTMWIFGIRYTDIFWMNVALLANAYKAFAMWSTDPAWYSEHVLKHISYIAVCLGVFGFLRMRIRPRNQALMFFALLAMAILVRELPASQTINLGVAILYSGLFGFAVVSGIRELKNVTGHRRKMIISAIGVCIFAIAAFLVSGILAEIMGIMLWDTITPLVLLAFATLFAMDLVMFHRGFKVAMESAHTEKQKRAHLEHTIELGLTMQKLLMPSTATTAMGMMRISTHFEAVAGMAGDWHFRSQITQDSFMVAFGDVVGKGPEAAIASTSILSMIQVACETHQDLASIIQWTDKKILSLFEGKITSTIAAVMWDQQSHQIKVISNGGFGWLLIRESGTKLLVSRGENLGTGKIQSHHFIEGEFKPEDKLLSFSDGVADGSRDINRVADLVLRTIRSGKVTGDQIIGAIKGYSESKPIYDDKTIICLERLS